MFYSYVVEPSNNDQFRMDSRKVLIVFFSFCVRKSKQLTINTFFLLLIIIIVKSENIQISTENYHI